MANTSGAKILIQLTSPPVMLRSFACAAFLAWVTPAAFAQAKHAPAELENVEIYASLPNTMPEMRLRFSRGIYELKNATLVDLIRTAWSVDSDKVVGGPDWLDLDRFDVIATAPADSTPETRKLVLRSLLADRFKLVAHEDTRDQPAYVITVGRKALLKPADGPEPTGCEIQQIKNPAPGLVIASVAYACRNVTMPAFANQLRKVREASGYLFNYPLVDRTGLKGAWDFSVQWSARVAQRPSLAVGETTTIFEALEKQLGLKLDLTKVPTPVLVIDGVGPSPLTNQPRTAVRPPAPAFEVASIKPAAPGDTTCGNINIQPGGSIHINMTLEYLIVEAWGFLIPPERIIGGPKDKNCFVVDARSRAQEDAVPGWNGAVWNGVDIDTMRMMLRTLLVDRFKLAAHQEDRLVPGQVLVAGSPKLRKADPSNRPGCKEAPGIDGKDPRLKNPLATRLITCRNMTLTQFAAQLNQLFPGSQPIMDSTGIAGRYDMTINFSPESVVAGFGMAEEADGAASEPNGAISLFEALNRQLGLKLQSRKVLAPVLVVDRVNSQPTEN
jgi:uncharacterized protein (TIGR03435 family)